MNLVIDKQRRSVPKYRIFFAAFIILLVSTLIFLVSYRVDKVIIEPGEAVPTSESVRIADVKQFEPTGQFDFLTVLISASKPSLAEYLKARLWDTDVDIFDWKEVNGDLTAERSNELNQALMLASQGAASSVALEKVGCEVPRSGTGAIITQVAKDTPASRLGLVPGDTIIQIDDKDILLDVDAVDVLGSYSPGDTVTLTYNSMKSEKDVTKQVKLEEHPENPTSAYLGVVLATRDISFDYPIDISFDSGGVTGPSAGLAFTLYVIDRLTPGELTGGKHITVTGEIALDGTVNLVGGVKQKAVAARNAGADIMIVPVGEGDQARKTAGDVKVFEVASLDQALEVLARNGGDELPQVQTCPRSE